MFTTSGRKQLLDATDITHVGLNSAYPAHTGTNEISGGSPAYARKAIAFATATGGTKTQSGTAVLDVSATSAVYWVTCWDASGTATGSSCRWVCPAGGQGKEFECSPTGDVITVAGHGYADNDPVTFYMTAPGGITAGSVYYVRDKTTDTFKVTATAGGTAINITARPAAGDALVSAITANTGGQRTVTISSLTLGANN